MMPRLLHKHFERLLLAHQQATCAAPEGEWPDQALQPGDWLNAFRQDMLRLLLAELDLRLQPVQGLLEAAAAHPTTRVS